MIPSLKWLWDLVQSGVPIVKEYNVINLSQNGWLVSLKDTFVLDAQLGPDFDCISSVMVILSAFISSLFSYRSQGRVRLWCLGLQAPGMSGSWAFITAQLLTLAVAIWLLHQIFCSSCSVVFRSWFLVQLQLAHVNWTYACSPFLSSQHFHYCTPCANTEVANHRCWLLPTGHFL